MRFTLRATGVPGESIDLQNGASTTGTGQILMDGSAGSFIELPGGTAGQAYTPFELIPDPTVPPVNAKVFVIMSTTYGPSNCPQVIIDRAGSGNIGRWDEVTPPTVREDGWLQVPVAMLLDTWPVLFNNSRLVFNNVNNGVGGKVYEASVVVTWSSEAPPCRLFPREDGLGVGAGRNYPPAKSQQRSSRGVGYY